MLLPNACAQADVCYCFELLTASSVLQKKSAVTVMAQTQEVNDAEVETCQIPYSHAYNPETQRWLGTQGISQSVQQKVFV